MPEAETAKAVELLDLLLEFFADGTHWTRGCYHDGHGRRCLVGAVDYLRCEHHIPSEEGAVFLQELDGSGQAASSASGCWLTALSR
jgi:hypothetical protein